MFLFVDITSHGFGHLSITAPVLRALARRTPELRLTVRSLVPEAQLRQRIGLPFTHIAAATDFGYVMRDALQPDLEASAQRYRQDYSEWDLRVAEEAAFLGRLAPDLVLSNVSDLPLVGAAAAGIPAAALCSLNWADIFAHYYGDAEWAAPIHARMLAAYRSARIFVRTTPGMPMDALGNVAVIGPVAARGQRQALGLPAGQRAVLLAMGGIAMRLPLERWPRLPGLRWVVPEQWQCRHPDAVAQESFGLAFTDLLASVDAVITKPGYGTFTEAACNGTPVLYQRRIHWPEEKYLADWLERHARCQEIAGEDLSAGRLRTALEALWAKPTPPLPTASGDEQAADHLLALR